MSAYEFKKYKKEYGMPVFIIYQDGEWRVVWDEYKYIHVTEFWSGHRSFHKKKTDAIKMAELASEKTGSKIVFSDDLTTQIAVRDGVE